MDRPKIDGIVDYIKAAYPDSWRDYVLCRAGTEEPIAVMFPHMGRIYYAVSYTHLTLPTNSLV